MDLSHPVFNKNTLLRSVVGGPTWAFMEKQLLHLETSSRAALSTSPGRSAPWELREGGRRVGLRLEDVSWF